MKFTKVIVMLLVCSVIFMGCPYSASVALDEDPAVKVDTRLVGKYEKGGYTYIVTKSDDFHYKIVEKSDDSETNYMGFLSKIGDDTFLNVYEENMATPTYYFYKVVIVDATTVELHPITDNIKETFTTAAELRSFIAKYKDLSFFYNTVEMYVKD